ncbi:MAG: xylulokinase [Arachnia sp.]
MAYVLGIDSSTQSTKALLVEADTGQVVEQRRAPHPEGTEVDPRAWLAAVDEAAGPLLRRASAVAVGGQQHAMVALDEHGDLVRDALLWNDTRSAPQAAELVAEMGGPEACVDELGYVLVASITSTKLRWMAEHEPENAARTASVLLPHDFVSHHLGDGSTAPVTDRGDASGTGYYSTKAEAWSRAHLVQALGHEAGLPEVAPAPNSVVGLTALGAPIAAGTGDNAAAALGLSLGPGEVSVSIGTSGVAAMVSGQRPADSSGTVTGFADASGRFLPMGTTINASGILDLGCRLLGVGYDELSRLALASRPGAGGVALLPYFGGERTPNRPDATGVFSGITYDTTRQDVARAVIEGLLCSVADVVAAVEQVAATQAARILFIGGGAQSEAVRALAPTVFGRPITVPPAAEYVALGAARQAAWALEGGSQPPAWELAGATHIDAEHHPEVLERYLELKNSTAAW